MREPRAFRGVLPGLVFALLLGACQKTPTQTPTSTRTGIRPLPEYRLPIPTPTFSFTATSEPTQTATVTPAPLLWGARTYAKTPLPPLSKRIHPSTAGQVVPLAVWGVGRVNDLALSPDGQLLAVATNLGGFFYDSLSYARLGFVPTKRPARAVAFSSDNRWIALGQSTAAVDILDRQTFSLITSVPAPDAALSEVDDIHLSFTPDVRHLTLIADSPATLRVFRWDTITWQPAPDFDIKQGEAVAINSSLDLAAVIAQQDLMLQSLSYPEENDLLDLPATLSPAFWDRLGEGQGQVVTSANGEFLLISNGAAIAHWEILSEAFTYLLDGYPDTLPNPCEAAPDACRDSQGSFSWDCSKSPSPPPIELLALSPDDVMVLISRNDRQTEFRRASDSVRQWDIEITFTDVTFSPGGEFFFGLRRDGVIEKRATQDGALIDFLDQHPDPLHDLAFSPDDDVLAVGFADGWIRVYATANGEMLGVLDGEARALAFSPDGDLLAAGLADGAVRIFELDAGRFYDLIPGHLAAVTDLVFSPDGRQLLTGSDDCTVALWNVRERHRLRLIASDPDAPFRLTNIERDFPSSTSYFSGNRPGVAVSQGESPPQRALFPDEPIADLTYVPRVNTLAVLGDSLWLQPEPHLNNPPAPVQVPLDQAGWKSVLAANPAGSLFVIANSDALSFWSGQGETVTTLDLSPFLSLAAQPVALALSPQEALIALGTRDGLIHIFGIPTRTGR